MTKRASSIVVMVTGVGGGGLGEQLIKCLRMADTPYEIVGCDMIAQSGGLAMADHGYVVPPAKDPDYLNALFKVCDKHSPDVLLHGCDPELKVFDANRQELARRGLFVPMNPPDVLETCFDKSKTAIRLQELGFKVPEFVTVRSLDDARQFDIFPALLKPSTTSGGSANIFLAQDPDELLLAAQELLRIFDEFVIQAYVGRPEDEYTVGVLSDMDGGFINSIAVHRLVTVPLSNKIRLLNRTGRDELGPVIAVSSGISQGEIGPFEHVTRPCEEIARALGSRGAINIQCRLVDGEVVVFEINPRFSGTSSLRAMVGYNEPDVLIRKHLLGDEIETRFPYRSGTISRGLSEILIDPASFTSARDL